MRQDDTLPSLSNHRLCHRMDPSRPQSNRGCFFRQCLTQFCPITHWSNIQTLHCLCFSTLCAPLFPPLLCPGERRWHFQSLWRNFWSYLLFPVKSQNGPFTSSFPPWTAQKMSQTTQNIGACCPVRTKGLGQQDRHQGCRFLCRASPKGMANELRW